MRIDVANKQPRRKTITFARKQFSISPTTTKTALGFCARESFEFFTDDRRRHSSVPIRSFADAACQFQYTNSHTRTTYAC